MKVSTCKNVGMSRQPGIFFLFFSRLTLPNYMAKREREIAGFKCCVRGSSSLSISISSVTTAHTDLLERGMAIVDAFSFQLFAVLVAARYFFLVVVVVVKNQKELQ